jgi:hypothetical protein
MSFWYIVPVGRSHSVFFTGTPPQTVRLSLVDGAPGDRLVVRLFYPGPLRLQVFVGGVYREDINMRGGQAKSQLVRDGRLAPNGPGGVYLEQGVAARCACFLAGQCVSASVESSRCDGRSDVHGVNAFERATSTLSVAIEGHDSASFIEIRAVPVVQVRRVVAHLKLCNLCLFTRCSNAPLVCRRSL